MGGTSIQPDLIDPTQVNIPDYQLLERLGQGSMGAVFRAHNAKLQVDVAVKILHSEIANDHLAQERFLRELKALAQLSHENIVKVLHSGVADTGEAYFVMEFLDGITLASELETSKTLSSKRFFEIIPQIAIGLAEIHSHKILHRDLRPGNIMLCKNVDGATTVKIIDLGIMRQDADSGASTLTQGNASLGSPSYMSPEQCRGQRASLASDVFAFGCIMYECISGTPPHRGETIMEILHKCITDAPAKLQIASHSKKAKQLSRLIMSCLQKDPAMRPQGAQEIGDEINTIFDQGSATPELFKKDTDRTIIVVSLATALGVLCVVAIALLAGQSHKPANNAVSSSVPKIGLSRHEKEISVSLLDDYSDQINGATAEIDRKKVAARSYAGAQAKLSELLRKLEHLSGKKAILDDPLRFGILQLRLRTLVALGIESTDNQINEEKESLKYADSNPLAAACVRNQIAQLYLYQRNAIEGKYWATEAIKHLRDSPKNRSENEIQVNWCFMADENVEDLAHLSLGVAACLVGKLAEAREEFKLANASALASEKIGKLLQRQIYEAQGYFEGGSVNDDRATLRKCLEQINSHSPFGGADGFYLQLAEAAERHNFKSLAREILRDGMSKYQANSDICAKMATELQKLK